MPVLVVQMGHCYRTTGATGTTGEQAYATLVGDACVRLLNGRNGWTVNKTLADENDYAGSAFVAIHCDGSTSPSARGASVGYRTPEGQQFAQAWKQAYAARGWPMFRPDNYTTALSGYYGTGNAVNAGNRRAFIAECGFRTNSQDRALLDAPGGPERVALAIGDALGISTGGFLMALTDSQQQQIYDSISGYNERRNAVGLPDKDLGAGLADAEQELANLKGFIYGGGPSTADGPQQGVADDSIIGRLKAHETKLNQIITLLNEQA
jgi:hypothetical protein